ncbi:MAG: universal stress protein [Nitrospirales bacterium]|nr:MAG: universal stress protein [Nitrospirales bacterium]
MKILLGVDFSRDSKTAIRFLSGIQFPANSELFLVHVKSGYEALQIGHSREVEKSLNTLYKKAIDRSRRNLEQIKDKLGNARLDVRTMMKEGNAGKEILSVLDQEHIDLAVLGTRGLSGIQRFLLGSVSEWILQDAPCPVLVVRGSSHWIHRRIRVLFTTDGSTEAQAALKFLNALRFPAESEIIVFHVVEGTDYRIVQDDFRELKVDSFGQVDLAKVSQDIQSRKEIAGRALVKEAKRGLINRHSNADHISTGHAAEEILKAARRFKTNLIVMGSRGLTGIKQKFLESVSTRVARHAPCSVLVARQLPKNARIGL